MANTIKYRGQLYKRVDSGRKSESAQDLKKFRDEVANKCRKLNHGGWADALGTAIEYDDKKEQQLIRAVTAKLNEGQKALKQSLHYLESAIGFYEEYDRLATQYYREYE